MLEENIVLMGVSGSGKTTVGVALAKELGASFYDGDSFHSKENKLKMAAGQPLTDDDRKPWLDSLAKYVSYYLRKRYVLLIATIAYLFKK